MFLKNNWSTYIHAIRKEEIKRAFSLIPVKKFNNGIEFGAGDGYQTTLIEPMCSKFVSSDLNFKRLKDEFKIVSVDYRAYDADSLSGIFGPNTFNLIFSSNLIEHLSNRKSFLQNTKEMLSSDGYAVHVVPAKMVKFTYLLLFYPNLLVLIIDRLIGIFENKPIFRGSANNFENNINSNKADKLNKWKRILLPQIHGNYKTHTEEWRSWSRKSWQKLFENNGYTVVNCVKGPAVSGYGFGWDRLRNFLEKVGWASEYIFILKNNKNAPGTSTRSESLA